MLIHHALDTYSVFQEASALEATALTSERDGSETAHLSEMVAILEMPLQIRAYGPLTCVSSHCTLFPLWHKKYYVTGLQSKCFWNKKEI